MSVKERMFLSDLRDKPDVLKGIAQFEREVAATAAMVALVIGTQSAISFLVHHDRHWYWQILGTIWAFDITVWFMWLVLRPCFNNLIKLLRVVL